MVNAQNRESDEYYIPEDVLREVEEAEKEFYEKGSRKKKTRYPSSRDIVEAVIIVAKTFRASSPEEYPDAVLEYLQEKGYDTRHVTVKRIWRTYEKLVREGVISDYLGVVV